MDSQLEDDIVWWCTMYYMYNIRLRRVTHKGFDFIDYWRQRFSPVLFKQNWSIAMQQLTDCIYDMQDKL